MMNQPIEENGAVKVLRKSGDRPLISRFAGWIGFSFFTALTVTIALGASLPASVVGKLVSQPDILKVSTGTIWNGKAWLEGGLAVEWKTRGLELLKGQISLDIKISGGQSAIDGEIAATPFSLKAKKFNGTLGPELLLAAGGNIEASCTGMVLAKNVELYASSSSFAASGRIDVKAGQCAGIADGTIAIPAMRIDLLSNQNSALARVFPKNGSSEIWGSLKLSPPANVILRIEPEGARVIPGMPSSRATIIEYEL